ncbi:MAG: hypothetical protein WDN45_06745 [Caulobacteraceae bacterium]
MDTFSDDIFTEPEDIDPDTLATSAPCAAWRASGRARRAWT